MNLLLPKRTENREAQRQRRRVKYYGFWARWFRKGRKHKNLIQSVAFAPVACCQSISKTQELQPGGSKTARIGFVCGPFAFRASRKHTILIKFCGFCAFCFQEQSENTKTGTGRLKDNKRWIGLFAPLASRASRKHRNLHREAQRQQGWIKFCGFWACRFPSTLKTHDLELGGSKTARMGQVMCGPVASRDCRKHMNLIKFCCFEPVASIASRKHLNLKFNSETSGINQVLWFLCLLLQERAEKIKI